MTRDCAVGTVPPTWARYASPYRRNTSATVNTPEHQFVGPLLHDRIIGALELCCRRGEMLLIQNKRANWDTCQIGIPGATAKDKENRRIPFDPDGRVAEILARRSKLGPEAYVFGSDTGAYQLGNSDRVGNPAAVGPRHYAAADAHGPRMEPRAAPADRPPLARPATRRRVPAPRRRGRHPDHPTDARPRELAADAALPERDGRRNAARVGGQLAKERTAAATRVVERVRCERLRKNDWAARLSDICPARRFGRVRFGCGGGI
jgi:hypothetical protein